MRYRNLIYCKHHDGDRRAYLYEMPLEMDVKPGEKLCVRDLRGEHVVTAFCENWLCSEHMTKVLCEANGGYFPPAEVVGTVSTVTVTQEVVNKFKTDVEEEGYVQWF